MDQIQAPVVAKKRVFLTSRNRYSMDLARRTQKSMWWILRNALEAAAVLAVVVVPCALSITSLRRKTVWRIPIWEWAMALLLTATSRRIIFVEVTIFGLLLRRIFTSKPRVVYVVSEGSQRRCTVVDNNVAMSYTNLGESHKGAKPSPS
ncbi:unnamed protein product [Microthlaspi erraticum]|uniref:Uncharacterized protein n=1 Tax=Microthlaspi erraticum TaxID=1685480 RepID=A0A6D2IQA1_9BRAS|nr:unnamed protein product [Microthlaspi erraticum]